MLMRCLWHEWSRCLPACLPASQPVHGPSVIFSPALTKVAASVAAAMLGNVAANSSRAECRQIEFFIAGGEDELAECACKIDI